MRRIERHGRRIAVGAAASHAADARRPADRPPPRRDRDAGPRVGQREAGAEAELGGAPSTALRRSAPRSLPTTTSGGSASGPAQPPSARPPDAVGWQEGKPQRQIAPVFPWKRQAHGSTPLPRVRPLPRPAALKNDVESRMPRRARLQRERGARRLTRQRVAAALGAGGGDAQQQRGPRSPPPPGRGGGWRVRSSRARPHGSISATRPARRAAQRARGPPAGRRHRSARAPRQQARGQDPSRDRQGSGAWTRPVLGIEETSGNGPRTIGFAAAARAANTAKPAAAAIGRAGGEFHAPRRAQEPPIQRRIDRTPPAVSAMRAAINGGIPAGGSEPNRAGRRGYDAVGAVHGQLVHHFFVRFLQPPEAHHGQGADRPPSPSLGPGCGMIGRSPFQDHMTAISPGRHDRHHASPTPRGRGTPTSGLAAPNRL